MDEGMVTIVIPAYNAEKYLHENIESIINQTYRNLEIIYVCDGCTDHTVEILQEYAEKDFRVIVQVESENHGAAISRNIGMNKANGEWVLFWDADDVYGCSAIEEMVEASVREEADLVCCYWEYFDDTPNEDVCVDNRMKKLYCSTYPVINTREELHHIMQLVDNSPCIKLVHKSLYTKEEMSFQDIPNANDVYFAKVVAMNSHKIVYVDKVFYHYRSNKGRHTLSTDGELKKSYLLEAFDKIYEYIRHKEDNLLLLRSFYNDVLDGIKVYLECPVYNTFIDMLWNVYFDKWEMLRPEVMEELSCINRVFYKCILNKSGNINLQDMYIQAKVEFVRILSHRGCSIWGTGKMGCELLKEISKTDIKVQHVFDSAQDNWGKKIYGYVVENFSEVQADDIIISTPRFYNEIAESIHKRAKNIYNLDEQIWLIPDRNAIE